MEAWLSTEEIVPFPVPRKSTSDNRSVFWNGFWAALLFLLLVLWTTVLFDTAWTFWAGTFFGAISSHLVKLPFDHEMFTKDIETVRQFLRWPRLFSWLVGAFFILLLISFCVARVDYQAAAGAKYLKLAGKRLDPGGVMYSITWPIGRSLPWSIDNAAPGSTYIRPWWRNSLQAPPTLIIFPGPHTVMQISDEDVQPQDQWSLRILVNGQERLKIAPYRGGPVLLLGAAPEVYGSSYPDSFKVNRRQPEDRRMTVSFMPGDNIDVELKSPSNTAIYPGHKTLDETSRPDMLFQALQIGD